GAQNDAPATSAATDAIAQRSPISINSASWPQN
ncbi:MAG: hypothetical protein QOI62_2511, partial [Solirubrobacteraceae bacterium]|nr:hypothetical protein [Solirubrobacteraceae bacterium]